MTAGGVGRGFFWGRNTWGGCPTSIPLLPSPSSVLPDTLAGSQEGDCGANPRSGEIRLINTRQRHPKMVKSSAGDHFCHTELPEEEGRGEEASDMLVTSS